jgi:hypothetical protein
MLTLRPGRAALLAAAVACVAASNSAVAITCYTLFDRNDNVVYRDTISPVDLSDQGAASRSSLQQRGEYLMISEEDRCAQVTFVFGNNGTSNLSTDDFLNGIRTSGSTRSSGATGSPAPRGAAVAPAAASSAGRTAAPPASK